MANKGYCVAADVANFLGRTLTTAQTTEATVLIGAVEAFIDRETNRAWLVSAITAERYDLKRPTIYLRYHPITSVQSIVTRTQAIGDIPYTAIAGVDYEVFDLNLGQINFSAGYQAPRAVALVSYTPNLGVVPADITFAATLIAANSLTDAILPDNLGVSQIRLGRYAGITFREDGLNLHVPTMAAEILAGYRIPILA